MNLIQPMELSVNKYGNRAHPDLLDPENFASNLSWEHWLREQKLDETAVVNFDCDASEELVKRYSDGDTTVINEWQPSKPDDRDGWFMLYITDSDDGPFCMWVRREVQS